jgi:histone H3/H4
MPPQASHTEDSEPKFHEDARAMAVQHVRSYGQRLVRDAAAAAKARQHPLVLLKDVQYAAQRLRATGRNRKNVFLQFIGAGLLGVFLQGFTAEMLAAEPEPWVAVFYVVIGFMGIFGVFWSLIR